ncbi:MAG TPA: sporulation YhaL family protein [Bacillales bacterium]|nr:sporulation YhaL family protein [Bacillales bacterium]
MSSKAQGWTTLTAIAAVMILLWTDWFSAAYAFLTHVPWFVYLIIAGILYSGFKFVRLAKEDYDADQEWIEEEGDIFMRRMKRERERREHDAAQ